MTLQQYALLAIVHNNTHEPMTCMAKGCRKRAGCAFAYPVAIPYAARAFWTMDYLCPDHLEEAIRMSGKLQTEEASNEEHR